MHKKSSVFQPAENGAKGGHSKAEGAFLDGAKMEKENELEENNEVTYEDLVKLQNYIDQENETERQLRAIVVALMQATAESITKIADEDVLLDQGINSD